MEKRRVGPEMRKLNNLIKREVERSTARQQLESLTGLHGWVIGHIARQDGPVLQRDLEERFSVRRSTMSNILSLMEKNALIVRTPSKKDSRTKEITLTRRAWMIDRIIKTDLDRIEELITDGLTEGELDAFFSAVDKMKENLERMSDNV